MNRILLPVKGCWVRRCNDESYLTGVVKDKTTADGVQKILVKWHGVDNPEWVLFSNICCGFKKGMDVSDVPVSRVRKSLGEGVTIDLRLLGGKEQVLVNFLESGKNIWLPYQNLKHIKGVRHRFLTGDTGKPEDAEKFRLRSLAYALELWNENTGSLSNMEIDPLPHQIHLVHHILASGNLNWLIADDVGLGKTIEVGMLLSALRQRKRLGRVLLITPAGLTKQWQEELLYKFGFKEFLIYGEDFHIKESHQWKLFDHVIGSIDRFKDDSHLENLLQAEPWDLIVFDEAHRLSRRQYGLKFDSSQRFRLAAELRKVTDNILLLTATPHQGFHDKFQALLEILRPELKKEIRFLSANPEILKHMVIRNSKADVTDAEGNFIFQGKTTKAIPVEVGKEARDFDRALQKYLKRGYSAGKTKGQKGRTIGFVMTTYRKLAASSTAAICAALERRLTKLKDDNLSPVENNWDDFELDSRYEGEFEEARYLFPPEFFSGEITILEDLIIKAKNLLINDKKLEIFLNKIISDIKKLNSKEKILIFTEYRSTQAHIANALQSVFGEQSVELIHGSMKQEERKEAIAKFEDFAQFLISTEAGGEGINLHRKCHVMVNYDLPWNPMRLVQRIGRLYRYGQKHNVVIFNIHSPQTMDEEIMGLMYQRINQVVQDLAIVGDEFKSGLEDDILGEIAELIDVQEILENATIDGIKRTRERIDEALKKASQAAKKQRDLFEFASSFDPGAMKNDLQIGPEHLQAFSEGMFKIMEIEVIEESHQGMVKTIRIPEHLLKKITGIKQRLQITFDRVLGSTRPNIHMLDLESPLVQFFLSEAKSYQFGGLCSIVKNLNGEALITGILRWQDDQGKRMRQEFTSFLLNDCKKMETNPRQFAEWLKTPASVGEFSPDREMAKEIFQSFRKAAHDRLESVSNRHLHPENKQWASAAWLEN